MSCSVLIEIHFGFSVLHDFLCGFSVSYRPQCPPPLAGVVLGSPEFNTWVALVNSQIAFIRIICFIALTGSGPFSFNNK